ncbi:diheme cytochrome c [Rhodoferax sp.]|uniref:diheme cytochrome c n=1 Tax=Rhodoferax sp. TaxID=50421 RepID=UPI002623D1F6|nr:diheme cytochrome c [Rhodoferax sp.]MDD2926552.1 diheme cytochrome c [Rhodoferax sp.]
MNIPYRPLALGLLLVGFSALLFGRAQAGGGHYYPPVTDPVVTQECGSCHLVFAPAMLPASSWQRMMGDLQNHFGEDASVDAASAKRITDYLTAQAGDTGGRNFSGKLLRGVSSADAPLRITSLSSWNDKHRKVPDWEWKHKEVQSKANCAACHLDAARGYYDE